jgi:hypothetical protein
MHTFENFMNARNHTDVMNVAQALFDQDNYEAYNKLDDFSGITKEQAYALSMICFARDNGKLHEINLAQFIEQLRIMVTDFSFCEGWGGVSFSDYASAHTYAMALEEIIEAKGSDFLCADDIYSHTLLNMNDGDTFTVKQFRRFVAKCPSDLLAYIDEGNLYVILKDQDKVTMLVCETHVEDGMSTQYAVLFKQTFDGFEEAQLDGKMLAIHSAMETIKQDNEI